ncbi:DUF3558 domain-containing protein [Amycolatopsis magusensis]|uniref:DUF3558 domain-containing protein n=1 Tax=Amycolatopsis magusensis TaxID=882444 RepID=UPI0024A9E63C|nr:DUF3558 domain-containing protein [Amycolatopsis magusensis]MDI5975323.1 DUF3558 domain-containing protein [Amycolatopsis magusensis]
MNKLKAVVLLVVAAASLAACSGETGGKPRPVETAAPQGSPTGQPPDGPSIPDPLDASPFLGNPCDLTPQAKLSGLGYTEPGEPKTEDDVAKVLAGPSCHWRGTEPGVGMTVQVQTGNRDAGIGGVAGLEKAKQSRQLGFLEQTEGIGGYPAFFAGQSDRRATGTCALAVGIADDLTFTVTSLGYQGAQDSCDNSAGVAAIVIDTLKGGA